MGSDWTLTARPVPASPASSAARAERRGRNQQADSHWGERTPGRRRSIGGTLQVGDGVTAGTTIASSGTVQVNGGGPLATNPDQRFDLRQCGVPQRRRRRPRSPKREPTLSGVISGTGAFNQNGLGTTILTNTQSLHGQHDRQRGHLEVSGRIASLNTTSTPGEPCAALGRSAGT